MSAYHKPGLRVANRAPPSRSAVARLACGDERTSASEDSPSWCPPVTVPSHRPSVSWLPRKCAETGRRRSRRWRAARVIDAWFMVHGLPVGVEVTGESPPHDAEDARARRGHFDPVRGPSADLLRSPTMTLRPRQRIGGMELSLPRPPQSKSTCLGTTIPFRRAIRLGGCWRRGFDRVGCSPASAHTHAITTLTPLPVGYPTGNHV